MHYASIPIEKGQLEFWARFIPLLPFWSSLIISDKIFGDCQLRSFTFEWYLGTSWTQSSSELKSIAVQTVYRQDVNKMWGRVEHLPQKSASNILAMKKIRKIFVFFKFHFHNDGRPRQKNYFQMFFWAHINLLVCKISSWSDMPNRFFANQCHIFHKYLTGIFFPESFESFWPARSGIFKIGSKLSKY